MKVVKEQVWHNGRMYERGEQVADDLGIPDAHLQNEEGDAGPVEPARPERPEKRGRR